MSLWAKKNHINICLILNGYRDGAARIWPSLHKKGGKICLDLLTQIQWRVIVLFDTNLLRLCDVFRGVMLCN